MKTPFYFLLAAVLLFSMQSCKEETDNNPNPTPKSKTDLLCASNWKMNALTVDPPIDVDGTMVTDWFSQFDACDKDDLTKYNTDKTGVYDEGPTKCDPVDPQTELFTWTFGLNDESKLTEDGETYDVESLTASTLKLSITLDGDFLGGVSGVNYKLTATFKH